MAQLISSTGKSKRGRPRLDTVAQHFTMPKEISVAIEAYASDEAITRPQAIRDILAEWLRTHGYGPEHEAKPTGPATRVVADMDAAIREHKRSKAPHKKPSKRL